MSSNATYDAFISYRHCAPDSEIAERLHKKLESFRLPKAVAKKVGKKRLGRVFRDDAELAVSDDLSVEIDRALRNSEYLIVICSPEYLRSEWCMRELAFFLQNKDRKHILLVLAEGEPDTAFPQVLMYEDVIRYNPDGSRSMIKMRSEPLAADCRGEDKKERNSMVDKAAVRIVASILGIGYDDLQQRQKREANRHRTIRLLIAFGVLFAVIGISFYFLVRISKQNEIIKQKYADSLANTSTNLLADGRKKDAVYAARLALPDKKTDNYSELATQALVTALGIYDTPDSLSCDNYISLPFTAGGLYIAVSPYGEYLSLRGLDDQSIVLETDSGNVLFSERTIESQPIVFDGDNGFVIKRVDENYHYYDLDSHTETDLGISSADAIGNDRGAGYLLKTFSDDIYFYRGSECICSFISNNELLNPYNRHDSKVIYTHDGQEAYIVINDYDAWASYVYIADLVTGSIRATDLAMDGLVEHFYTDGNTAVWSYSPFIWDPDIMDTSSLIYAQDISAPDSIRTTQEELSDVYGLCVNGDDIVAYTADDIYVYDINLNLIRKDHLSGYISEQTVTDEGICLAEEMLGFYIIYEGELFYLCPEGISADSLMMQKYNNGTMYMVRTGDDHISVYDRHRSDYLAVYDGEYEYTVYSERYERSAKRFREAVLDNEDSYDKDSIYSTFLCDNAELGLIQLWDGTVYIYDLNTLDCIKTIYAMDGYVSSFSYDRNSAYYYINGNNLDVYDEDLNKIYEVPVCSLLGFDPDTGKPVVARWSGSYSETYLLTPVTYDEIIEMADELLEDYEPDERVREKYSL